MYEVMCGLHLSTRREVSLDFALRCGYMPARSNPGRIVNGDYRGAFLESRKYLQRQ